MIVVCLLGCSGSGKTALATAIAEGMKHLVAVPQLRALMQGSVRIGDSEAVTIAHREGDDLLHVIEAQGHGVDCLLLETWTATDAVAELFDVLRVVVVTPWPLACARMRYRYERIGDPEAYERVLSRHNGDGGAVNISALDHIAEAGVPALYVDGRDYPLQEIDAREARAMLSESNAMPALDPRAPRCQQAISVGGIWYGAAECITFERARLDSILPADMTGMDMLDVGCCNGGFSLEAANRGALCVTAVDVAESGLTELRAIRDAYGLPITTATLNAETDPLPVHRVNEEPQRYSLALLLNIMHRVADPEALLSKVLAVSNAVTIEAPGCAVPYIESASEFAACVPMKPEWARYPGTWHFPPLWVQRVANSEGFRLASMHLGPYMAEQRLIWKLERIA